MSSHKQHAMSDASFHANGSLDATEIGSMGCSKLETAADERLRCQCWLQAVHACSKWTLANYEIWKYCQSTSKVHAYVLQNLRAHEWLSSLVGSSDDMAIDT